MGGVSADKLTAIYIKIRDRRAAILKEYEAADSVLKEQLEIVQRELLEICKTSGAESIRTKAGTVTRSVKTRYWTNDWSEMYDFIMEHNMPQLLEQRVHQTNIRKFLEENPDVCPKGLNIDSRYAVTVRRA